MPTYRTSSRLLGAFALLALAACDGDGGSGSDRLTRDDVAGTYTICALRFTPSQTALPVADLMTAVIDPSPPAGKLAPSLTLAPDADRFQLAYTRRSNGFTQLLTNEVDYGRRSATLELASEEGTTVQRELLLPEGALELDYDEATRRFEAPAGVPGHYVRRSDYARAAGITEEGLQERIFGRLTGTFARGSCPS